MNKTISEFLAYLKIPISRAYCERLIASHAEFPSLLSIVDTLERLGIRCIVGKIEKEKLEELTFPYLLQVNTQHGEMIAIKNAKDLTENEENLKHWDGIVLQVEPTSSITDSENNRIYKKERFLKFTQIGLLMALGLLLLWPIRYDFSPAFAGLFITSLIGSIIGYLLVAKDLGIKYKVVENFCASGKNSDCDKILDSDGANLFGSIKLSDAVICFFIFQTFSFLLYCYLPVIGSTVFFSFAVISLILIPVAVFSVYYQYAKAKSWCKLCLIVDGLLVAQVLLFGYFYSYTSFSAANIRLEVFVIQALAFVIFSCAYLIFKNKIEVINNLNEILPSASRVKNNAQVFRYLLIQQRKVNVTLMEHEVLVGDRQAPIKIVMITNLYCKPCKDQHEILTQLIKTFPDKINVAFRFVVSKSRDTNLYVLQFWRRFIHLKSNESDNTNKLIHDWYAAMNLDTFKKMYPMDISDGPDFGEDIEMRHSKWIERLGINRTPTFFINGYEMPKLYELKDMISFIQSLAEELNVLTSTEQSNKVSMPVFERITSIEK